MPNIFFGSDSVDCLGQSVIPIPYQFWGRPSDQVPEGFFSHCKLFFPVQIIPCGFEGTLLGLATPIRVTGSGRKTQCRLYLASYSCGLHGKGLFGSCFDTTCRHNCAFPQKIAPVWNIFASKNVITSSVSPELLQRFAHALARVAFLRNMALLSINMKAIWRASFLKSREQADQCNNSGETEEVVNHQIT